MVYKCHLNTQFCYLNSSNILKIFALLNMKQSSLFIRSFFKELHKFPVQKYYSQPHTIQSSVGIIFRFPDISNIQTKQEFNAKIVLANTCLDKAELFFVQRAGYQADRNAYNVVFPGGQCDFKQSDIQACERQLTQQIGIQTSQHCIHLGQLPKNFYYLKKRGKEVHISCHIYCLKSSFIDWEPKLNSDQIRKFKWVPILDLFKPQNYLKNDQTKLSVFERMPGFAAKIAKQNIVKVTMQELNLGMDRNLWGLTLYLWSYMLQMALKETQQKLQKQESKLIKGLINSMMTFELQFKPYSLYKLPASLIAIGWHYLYRVRPFEYKPDKFNRKQILSNGLVFLVSFIIILNLWYAFFGLDFCFQIFL